MLVSVALAAFALGKGPPGHELVPMPLTSGSLFQPELLVIVTGMFFTYFADPMLVHDIENTLGELWVFGGILLFSMLGSKTSTGILPKLVYVLPLMGIGFASRFCGVLAGICLTTKARGSSMATALPDAAFCFLCTLPRATIQGALGAVPLKARFFATDNYRNRFDVRDFIFTAAKLYIVCTSVCGMILLNTLGPKLLAYTESCHTASGTQEDAASTAGLAEPVEHQDGAEPLDVIDPSAGFMSLDARQPPIPTFDLALQEEQLEEDMLKGLAEKHNVDLELLRGVLRGNPKGQFSCGAQQTSSPQELGMYINVGGQQDMAKTSSHSLKTILRRHQTVVEGFASETSEPLRVNAASAPELRLQSMFGGSHMFDANSSVSAPGFHKFTSMAA